MNTTHYQGRFPFAERARSLAAFQRDHFAVLALRAGDMAFTVQPLDARPARA